MLEAALALLAERGPAAVTIDGLAASARVSKATIYRHWSCKEDIYKEAVSALESGVERTTRARSTRAALVAHAAALATTLSATQHGHRMTAIAVAAAGDPALAQVWEEAVIAPHRDALRRVLRTAREEGTAREDLDTEIAAELIVAPVLRRALRFGPDVRRGVADTEGDLERYARRVATTVWAGVAR